MKRWIVICAFIFALGIPMTAQVTVPQTFVDQADKAFQEVVSDRAVIDAKNQAIAAKDGEISAKQLLIDALTSQNKLKDAQIADLAKLKCDKTTIFFVVKITRCR